MGNYPKLEIQTAETGCKGGMASIQGGSKIGVDQLPVLQRMALPTYLSFVLSTPLLRELW